MVPMKDAFEFDELDQHLVDLTRDLRAPAVIERRERCD